MPKVAKTKRFRGKKRWEIARENSSSGHTSTSNHCNSSSPSMSTSAEQTVSTRKIRNQRQENSESLEDRYSYRLGELSSLMRACQSLHQCEAGGELVFNDDQVRKYGNSSVIQIECTEYETKVELQTSGNKYESWKPQNAMDINKRMVYTASEMGVGREAISVLCDSLNMPPP